MNESITIQVRYINTIFANPDMSYMVVLYEDVETNSSFPAVGAMLPTIKGTKIVLKGTYTETQKYGLQFRVDEAEEERPSDLREIEEYLCSAKIEGIGKATAAKIVTMFGEKTFHVMEHEPEQLVKIRGINAEKAERISQEFKNKSMIRETIMAARKLGLSVNIANKIFGKFGGQAIEIIEKQPYMLCFVNGIAFSTIDTSLRKRAGFHPCNGARLQAAMNQSLLLNEMAGHLFIEPKKLAELVYHMLNSKYVEEVPLKFIQKAINYSVGQKAITYADGMIYRNGAFAAEEECAEKIAELLKNKIRTFEVEKHIKAVEKKLGYELAQKQKEAVQMVFHHPLSIITGGPGRGKTTVIKTILEVYKKIDKEATFALCAPTGKAARRMADSTGVAAYTMHRMLGLMDEHDENIDPIEVDCVIADEFSMVDQYLAKFLFRALESGTRIILVGDKDQLPSVRAGNVFREFIECGEIPTTILDVVYRQKGNNSIIANSDKINEGDIDLLFDNSTIFLSKMREEHIAEAVLNCIIEEREHFKDDEIQVLTPYRKNTKIGSDKLNLLLQDYMNPPGIHKKEIKTAKGTWRLQDKVMMLKNTEDASNGDTGRIVTIVNTGAEPYMEVLFDTKVLRRYEYADIDMQLQLNYACTIHKSQGSEYPFVIIPMSMLFENMLKRNLIYTAITRASVKVCLIGDKNALSYAILHTDTDKRNTMLGERIKRSLQQYEISEPEKLMKPSQLPEKEESEYNQLSF